MTTKIIMASMEVKRTLIRLAHEIIERNKSTEKLVLVGIYTRGVPLAQRLSNNLESYCGCKIPVGSLDITPYRDDLNFQRKPHQAKKTQMPVNVKGLSVVLIDDVLFTGRSARAAMDAVTNLGRPKSMQLAVLVDRGHRELPIHADYVGKNIPSARHELIQVRLTETDGIDEVTITSNEQYTGK